MRRIFLGLSIAALASTACLAEAERSHAYDDFIAQQAKKHGVPESLVHRILRRESRYDPKVFHNHCYGLMQIKYGTAQSMGYHGAPKGLFDPYVNMTYAIPYLANAYRVADGDEDRAVSFFAAGYYYAAKKKQLLAALRTADSPPLAPEPSPLPAPAQPRNPMADLFAFLQSPAQNPVQPTQVQVAQVQATQVQATKSKRPKFRRPKPRRRHRQEPLPRRLRPGPSRRRTPALPSSRRPRSRQRQRRTLPRRSARRSRTRPTRNPTRTRPPRRKPRIV